jgi:hypothetical protein
MAGPFDRARGRSVRAGVLVVAVLTATVSVAARPSRPARAGWDPRIAPIAHEVEQLRHLRFLHPIPARFLSDRAFRKVVTEDDAPPTEERRLDHLAESELRALGLVAGSFDLHTTVDDVNGSDILAFYDSDAKRVVVRGKKLDAERSITLAHELTHGLQDQHYDLGRLEDATRTSGEDDALTALVEGDATRVEDDYYFKLSEADQHAVDAAEGAGDAPSGAPGSPDELGAGESFVSAQLDAPYAVGPGMVDVILATRHRPGLAHAFRSPPTLQLQMLQPSLAGTRVRPAHLVAPEPAAGEHRRRNGPPDIGAMDLYFLLASRLPVATAIRAADAWGNGRELLVERGHTVCADLAFTGRDRDGSRRIADALRAWSAAMPAGTVEVRRQGLEVRACDPGASAAAPPNSADDALGFAADRAYLESSMVEGGVPTDLARCMADAAVVRPDYQHFVEIATGPDQPKGATRTAFEGTLDALVQGCS